MAAGQLSMHDYQSGAFFWDQFRFRRIPGLYRCQELIYPQITQITQISVEPKSQWTPYRCGGPSKRLALGDPSVRFVSGGKRKHSLFLARDQSVPGL